MFKTSFQCATQWLVFKSKLCLDEILVLLVPVFLSSVCTPDLDNFLQAPLLESVRQQLTQANCGLLKNCLKKPNPKKV